MGLVVTTLSPTSPCTRRTRSGCRSSTAARPPPMPLGRGPLPRRGGT